jgi:hypothetical protein
MLTLIDRLRSRPMKLRSFLAVLREAIAAGEEGAAALGEVLDGLSKDRQVYAAQALGVAEGKSVPEALRRILQRPSAPAGVRGVALGALADRCGVAASADFVAALNSRVAPVQDIAVQCLTCAGDDRAWEQVFARLQRHLRRSTRQVLSSPTHPTEVLMGICYLACHLGQAGSPRNIQLLGLIRGRWENLNRDELSWLEQYWPGSGPRGPALQAVDPPNAEVVRGWLCGPVHDLKERRDKLMEEWDSLIAYVYGDGGKGDSDSTKRVGVST